MRSSVLNADYAFVIRGRHIIDNALELLAHFRSLCHSKRDISTLIYIGIRAQNIEIFISESGKRGFGINRRARRTAAERNNRTRIRHIKRIGKLNPIVVRRNTRGGHSLRINNRSSNLRHHIHLSTIRNVGANGYGDAIAKRTAEHSIYSTLRILRSRSIRVKVINKNFTRIAENLTKHNHSFFVRIKRIAEFRHAIGIKLVSSQFSNGITRSPRKR